MVSGTCPWVRPQYQLCLLVGTAALAMLLVWIQTSRFNAIDVRPELHAVSPEVIRQWGVKEPQLVEAGLHISRFTQFDVIKRQFAFEGTLWFLFDPIQVSLETLERFSIAGGAVKMLSQPRVRVIGNKLLAEFQALIAFKPQLRFSRFPLDDHRLFLVLENQHVSAREINFSTSITSFTLGDEVAPAEWAIVDTDTWTGFSRSVVKTVGTDHVTDIPRILFTIDIKRRGVVDIVLIVLPLFVISFISLFCLSFDNVLENMGTLLSLSLASISGALYYRYVIQGLSPKSSTFMLSDFLFVLFLLIALSSFISSLIRMYWGNESVWDCRMRVIILYGAHTAFLISWWYLLYQWQG